MSAIAKWLAAPPFRGWIRFSRGATMTAGLIGGFMGYGVASSSWEDLRIWIGIVVGMGTAVFILHTLFTPFHD